MTLIEQHNPDVRFDWPRILKGEEEVSPSSLPAVRPPRTADTREGGARTPREGSRRRRRRERPRPPAASAPPTPQEPAEAAGEGMAENDSENGSGSDE